MLQFDEEGYGKQASQRIATVLVYLSDVEEGGETSFLFEGVGGTKRIKTVDYKACDTGIKYKPRVGDALLFWSMHPDGSKDKHSLHGGCPVVKGTKWTMTKWIRDKCVLGGQTCAGEGVD
jgi:prolyl 4-hydroxylase